ncbi:D-mannose-1-phosphate guanyltransferase [Bacteroidia bacterium]|nr:D-mannose-1-phosphate guanyltransferase [Bacteroidia bacterium]
MDYSIEEAVVLAGGFGTRLQSVVQDVPKPMAPVANKPFLEYLLIYLEHYHCKKVVLATGYKHTVISDYFGTQYKTMQLVYAVEQTPLGTGGAMANALRYCETSQIAILNGDSLFDVDLSTMLQQHVQNNADMSIALKPMLDFERYGSVEIATDHRIVQFNEKRYCEKGLINGGVYIINKAFTEHSFPCAQPFSFEKEILEQYHHKKLFYGYVSDGYFIDIGIPTDYQKAQTDLVNRL